MSAVGRLAWALLRLLRSDLSLNIVIAYLDTLASGGVADKPYFSMRPRRVISTGGIGRSKPPPKP